MPKSSLYPKFVETLKGSAFAKQLNEQEIAELMKDFSEADDDKISAAIAKLNEDDKKLQAVLDNQNPISEEGKKLFTELKASIKSFDKSVLDYNIEQDKNESSESADKLIVGLSGHKNDQTKKKKIFGIF